MLKALGEPGGLEGVGSAEVGREGGGVGSAATASLDRLRDGRRSCFCFTASSCLRSAQHTPAHTSMKETQHSERPNHTHTPMCKDRDRTLTHTETQKNIFSVGTSLLLSVRCPVAFHLCPLRLPLDYILKELHRPHHGFILRKN